MASVRGIGVAVITRMCGGCSFLGPEPGALLHAEAVLLVDHHEPQVGELHAVFDQGVRADQDVHLARGDPFERQPALPGLRGAGEDGDLHPHAVEHTRDGGEMLAGEDLGGRHHAGLVAVVHGQQHRHQRHEGLAAADVALQQAVHLVARDGVLPDLLMTRFCAPVSGNGRVFVVEGVEDAPDLHEQETVAFGQALRAARLDVELDAQQFVEFQPVLCLPQQFRATAENGCCSRRHAAVSARSGFAPRRACSRGYGLWPAPMCCR